MQYDGIEEPRTACAINQPVAILESGIDGFGCFLAVVFPSAHADLGEFGAIAEPDDGRRQHTGRCQSVNREELRRCLGVVDVARSLNEGMLERRHPRRAHRAIYIPAGGES